MKKINKIKVKYVYIEPKTPEEKADQQRRLDKAFDMIFNEILKEDLKANDNIKSNEKTRVDIVTKRCILN